MRTCVCALLLACAVLLAVFCAPAPSLAAEYTQASSPTNINAGWQFHYGDVAGAHEQDFDDSSWRSVRVPHDYSSELDFTTGSSTEAESGFLPGGVGWYRKSFVLDESCAGKVVQVHFDGVYMNATVWINGHRLGIHPYGYTPFSFDLSDYVACDGATENVLAVKVDHQLPSSRWYSGSGIIRDVNLTVQDPTHIPVHGVVVTAPNLESEAGGVVQTHVATTVANEREVSKRVTVHQEIYDASFRSVGSSECKVTVAAGASMQVGQDVATSGVQLWSPESPAVYHVRTDVVAGGKVVDTAWTEFGYRYCRFDANTGFYLNGQPMKIKGACLHSDYGALGTAVNETALRRQLQTMKDMGVNAIRVSHNPASTQVLHLCNVMGLMVDEEAFDTWSMHKSGNDYDYGSYFSTAIGADNQILAKEGCNNWVDFDIRQMVKQSRNAPCVILYSIGNELFQGNTSALGRYNYPRHASYLVNAIHELSPSHTITVGDNVRDTNKNGTDARTMHAQINETIAAAGGAIGWNYASGGDYDRLHASYPTWPMLASETSSALSTRDYYLAAGVDDQAHQVGAQASASPSWGDTGANAWQAVVSRDFIAGEFVWTGIDYTGEPDPWNSTGPAGGSGQPSPKSSYFGQVDTAGFEKDSFYFYQSQWNDEVTTLHLAPYWEDALVAKDQGNVDVRVYSDAASVELFLNDESLGRQTFETHATDMGYTYQTCQDKMYLSWQVPYADGTLRAVAYDAGGAVIEDTQGRSQVSTPGPAASLKITAYESTIVADGDAMAYVEVEAVDAQGNSVHAATDEIVFTVSGNGSFEASDNGDPTDTTNMKSNVRKLFFGKALGIVRSSEESGSITVTATSEALGSASVAINTVPAASEQRPQLDVQDIPADDDTIYRIFHLDSGRKYFEPARIRNLIDKLAANGYSHIELAVGNNGLRLLLDDMTVETPTRTYTSEEVKAAIHAGNEAYVQSKGASDARELTQADMDGLIAYAKGKGIEVIPLVNSPGHMNAIVTAMEQLGIEGAAFAGDTTGTTMDLTCVEAQAFVKVLAKKYMDYFASHGSTLFNVGCDEYALGDQGASDGGFQGLINKGQYWRFIDYLNELAALVKEAGMRPMAFNDGIYYNNRKPEGHVIDTDILVSFWSTGWPGYTLRKADKLVEDGFEIVNTHKLWYYTLGDVNDPNGTYLGSMENVEKIPCDSVVGSGTLPVRGAMVCLWCDEPGQLYDDAEERKVGAIIDAFAERNPSIFPVEDVSQNVPDIAYRIFHLDCGRKYFTPEQICGLIDIAAEEGYSHVELAVGNGGLRLLLDDMTVKSGGATYASDKVKEGIREGNRAYFERISQGETAQDEPAELTQDDMDAILAHAKKVGIGIIPLVNTPGHMDAILTCMDKLGISQPALSVEGKTSTTTMDMNNVAARTFAAALVQRYIDYFGAKGCDLFNLGCDEYGADIDRTFYYLMRQNIYPTHIDYVNNLAAQVKQAGMTPLAFNDGFYFRYNETHFDNRGSNKARYESYEPFDTDIVICYYARNMGFNQHCPPSVLMKKGHRVINANDRWYYVLGSPLPNGAYSYSRCMDGVNNVAYSQINNADGSEDMGKLVGTMTCVWCDRPAQAYDESEQEKVATILGAFARANPELGWQSPTPAPTELKSAVADAATYTGSAQKPAVTVEDADGKTVPVSAYTVDYANNVNAGTATVTVTAKEASGYSGTVKTTFAIAPASIAKASVALPKAAYASTGKALKPSVAVKMAVGGSTKTLKVGTDYTVSYKNNVNAGTATVTVFGKGNYAASKSATFKIKSWKRLAGSNALKTMEQITRDYGKASVAIVTTNALAGKGVDAGYKDALAATALAGSMNAALLTTSKAALSAETKSELVRMGVKSVYVVGSAAEVAAKVDAQIKALGIAVTRISDVAGQAGAASGKAVSTTAQGASISAASGRAIACAKLVKGRSDTVIIATQNNFKDALAISSYAYASKSPILYAEGNKKLGDATLDYIKSAKFKKAIIVGGPVALPKGVETQLRSAGIAANSVTRLAGSNQYKTARVIAEWATGKLKNGTGGGKDSKSLYYYASVKFQPTVRLSVDKLGVARADDNKIGWKDALAGAALCGRNKSVVLLADAVNDGQAAAFVKANKAQIASGYVFGGTLAVPKATMDKLAAASL